MMLLVKMFTFLWGETAYRIWYLLHLPALHLSLTCSCISGLMQRQNQLQLDYFMGSKAESNLHELSKFCEKTH